MTNQEMETILKKMDDILLVMQEILDIILENITSTDTTEDSE